MTDATPAEHDRQPEQDATPRPPRTQTDVEVFLEPSRDGDGVKRTLRVNDRRSGMAMLTVELDADLFMRLLGGQPVHNTAWLLPRPQRDVLGHYRVPLTVRALAQQPVDVEGLDTMAAWIDSARHHLAPLGVVEYIQRQGIDTTAPEEVFVTVCTFILYADRDDELAMPRQRKLRTELRQLARSMGVVLAPSENDPGRVHRDALVRRENDWWVIEIGEFATQAEKPSEAEHMARDLLAAQFDMPYENVTVTLTFVGDDVDRAAWEAGLDAREATSASPA